MLWQCRLLIAGNLVHLASSSSDAWPAPTRLRVEGLEQQQQGLIVISEPLPRFAFSHGVMPATMAAAPRGLAQTAYRITVRHAGAVVWDSGVARSTNCSGIPYTGSPLLAFEPYSWSVAWLATDGKWSANATGSFEMGPVAESDWAASDWLTGSQLRAELRLPAGSTVARARAYIAAAGCSHIEINGRRPVPDLRGICAWTVVEKRVHYQSHDITPLVHPGTNVVGILSNALTNSHPWLHLATPVARAIVRVELAGAAGGGTCDFCLLEKEAASVGRMIGTHRRYANGDERPLLRGVHVLIAAVYPLRVPPVHRWLGRREQ